MQTTHAYCFVPPTEPQLLSPDSFLLDDSIDVTLRGDLFRRGIDVENADAATSDNLELAREQKRILVTCRLELEEIVAARHSGVLVCSPEATGEEISAFIRGSMLVFTFKEERIGDVVEHPHFPFKQFRPTRAVVIIAAIPFLLFLWTAALVVCRIYVGISPMPIGPSAVASVAALFVAGSILESVSI